MRDSLRFTLADGVHEVNHPGLGLQQASSYIAGLTPRPYWDVRGGDFPWLVELEKNFEVRSTHWSPYDPVGVVNAVS